MFRLVTWPFNTASNLIFTAPDLQATVLPSSRRCAGPRNMAQETPIRSLLCFRLTYTYGCLPPKRLDASIDQMPGRMPPEDHNQ